MNIDLLLRIAGIGILVAVLHQILTKAGRDDQAMMTTLAGMVIVLTIVVKEISSLFETVRTVLIYNGNYKSCRNWIFNINCHNYFKRI